MFRKIFNGILAGLVATLVLSLIMQSKGVIPQFETITLLIGMARVVLEGSGLPAPFAGWLWFFIVGGLWWGSWFAIISAVLPGRSFWVKGAVFGVVIGLLVIWTIMPLAAAGALGMKLSLWQPVVTIFEHLIYGVILGLTYSRLISR